MRDWKQKHERNIIFIHIRFLKNPKCGMMLNGQIMKIQSYTIQSNFLKEPNDCEVKLKTKQMAIEFNFSSFFCIGQREMPSIAAYNDMDHT